MDSHVTDTAYTRYRPAAVRAAGTLIPAGARMWVHRPRHLGLAAGAAPAVLAFDAQRISPPLLHREPPLTLDLRPFESFLRDNVRPSRDEDVPCTSEER